jgi:hypothetical protein
VHAVAAMLAAQHLTDLLREAEDERRIKLFQGARRSSWSAFRSRLAGRFRPSTGAARRADSSARPSDARPAAA